MPYYEHSHVYYKYLIVINQHHYNHNRHSSFGCYVWYKLLTKNSWQLSPAYDLNPSLSYDHAIMITDNTNHSDLQMLYNNCESYMLEPPKAKEIIQRVCDAVSDWQRLAVKLQIAKAEMEMFRRRFEEGCNIKYGL